MKAKGDNFKNKEDINIIKEGGTNFLPLIYKLKIILLLRMYKESLLIINLKLL